MPWRNESRALRWTEETERGPSVKARVSDCQPRWRIRIPLLAGFAINGKFEAIRSPTDKGALRIS